jgi:ElaB/YqjD/DUF883 family membrane-anchored ribosome-binding protein
MSDFGTDKNTQFAEDKAKNKFDELAGSAQQQFGEFVDSPKHQVKVRLKNMPRRPAMPFPTSLAVRNNPLTGLVAAGAVGIVLGLLLGRK